MKLLKQNDETQTITSSKDVEKEKISVVENLLNTKKFKINKWDNQGNTPIHLAALNNKTAVLEYCLTEDKDKHIQP